LSEHEFRISQRRNKLHQVLLTGKLIGNGSIGRQRGNMKYEWGCNFVFFYWNFGVLLPAIDKETKVQNINKWRQETNARLILAITLFQ